jgi:hypothetical protein
MVFDTTLAANRELRIGITDVMLVLLAIILGTFLRVSLFVIYPFVVLFIIAGLKLRFTRHFFDLMILVGVSLLLSFLNGLFIKYKLMSLYFMIPFLALMFTNPGDTGFSRKDLVKFFFRSLTVIALINNLVGFVQFFSNPKSDDSFTGIYSTFSVSLSGLSILNCTLFIYYFFSYWYLRKRSSLYWAIFFLISSVMAFYGAGLIVFLGAFVLTFLRPKLFSLLKLLILFTIFFWLGIKFLQYVKPNVVDYYATNLRRIVQLDERETPRKLYSFRNYAKAYPSNVKDFLFGSGPGTFNSRSAFSIGSPSYFTTIAFLKSEDQPYYFKNYAYPLWNETNTSQARFQDGFRNQPFSTILAFLGEYGLIFTLVFAWYYYKQNKRVLMQQPGAFMPLYEAYRKIFKFMIIFLPLLLLIDNFLEYPEIILLIVLIMKLLQISMNKMRLNETNA